MTNGARIGLAGIGMISFRTRDIDESAHFYETVFDMQPHFERTALTRVCTLTPSGDESHFSVKLTEGRPLNGRSAIEYIGLEVDSEHDVDVIHERSVQVGARATPPNLRDNLWQMVVFDPDGHKIKIFHEDAHASDSDFSELADTNENKER